jgi:hypothetical protein
LPAWLAAITLADCQKINDAIRAGAISAARADMSGANLPAVPPGTYYLMISARIGNQPFTLDQRSASPLN